MCRFTLLSFIFLVQSMTMEAAPPKTLGTLLQMDDTSSQPVSPFLKEVADLAEVRGPHQVAVDQQRFYAQASGALDVSDFHAHAAAVSAPDGSSVIKSTHLCSDFFAKATAHASTPEGVLYFLMGPQERDTVVSYDPRERQVTRFQFALPADVDRQNMRHIFASRDLLILHGASQTFFYYFLAQKLWMIKEEGTRLYYDPIYDNSPFPYFFIEGARVICVDTFYNRRFSHDMKPPYDQHDHYHVFDFSDNAPVHLVGQTSPGVAFASGFVHQNNRFLYAILERARQQDSEREASPPSHIFDIATIALEGDHSLVHHASFSTRCFSDVTVYAINKAQLFFHRLEQLVTNQLGVDESVYLRHQLIAHSPESSSTTYKQVVTSRDGKHMAAIVLRDGRTYVNTYALPGLVPHQEILFAQDLRTASIIAISGHGDVYVSKPGYKAIYRLGLTKGQLQQIALPFEVRSAFLTGERTLLLLDQDDHYHVINLEDA